jgi:hypothetical protein
VIFLIREYDGSFPIIIFYINDGLYFATSEGAMERLKKGTPRKIQYELPRHS